MLDQSLVLWTVLYKVKTDVLSSDITGKDHPGKELSHPWELAERDFIFRVDRYNVIMGELV